jgi:hypothetical protein
MHASPDRSQLTRYNLAERGSFEHLVGQRRIGSGERLQLADERCARIGKRAATVLVMAPTERATGPVGPWF